MIARCARPAIASLLLVTVACTQTAGDQFQTGRSSERSDAAPGSPGVRAGRTETPSPTPHGDVLTVSASIGYSGFAEWTSVWSGIALVEVIDVGAIRWTTPTGQRPEEARLHSVPQGHEGTPGIGRLVTARRISVLSGQWPPETEFARYWRPGGRVGSDEMLVDIPLPPLAPGQQALAFVLPQAGNVGGDGAIIVEAGWLFPIDDRGRVLTLDPNENVTLENLPSFLP